MTKTKIINYFSGPGAGKSTAAAGLFHEMKKRNYSVEYATEYAKDVVFENTTILLENQLHIFSEQFRRQFKLLGKVDYIITDSPILLSCIYFDEYNAKTNRYDYAYSELTKKYFRETFNQFDNINYFIHRESTKYVPSGRVENVDQAISLDQKIKDYLNHYNIPYQMVLQETAVITILNQL